ncbi:MAG TPA: Qat anti-phage system QueC-like protein QatC [Vicinamibacterales bacterium]
MALYEDGTRLCTLDIQYSMLRTLRNPNPLALDFLVLASAVYALDKTIVRATAQDGWTRECSLSMPVSDPGRWNAALPELTEAITFLTGDRWRFAFAPLSGQIAFLRRAPRTRHRQVVIPTAALNTVCLFSGGLDSLVGAIDHLEQEGSKLLLIGHHDGDMAGPFSDQRNLIEPLRAAYPQRLRPIFVRIGQAPSGDEITLRSRSLLFIALGMYGASTIGPEVPLLIPENGTIALNFPLTPSRRGSCSTRTAHPYYLEVLGRALRRVGFANRFANPLAGKTKGEVVSYCANPELLARLAPLTVSCAKRSRRGHWKRTTARSCGQCMPCIYRRAALHQAGRDDEVYGNDVCAGEVDVSGEDDAGRDFRACLSLLRRNPSSEEIASTLMASGPLDVSRLTGYASLVQRAMDEIRNLARDKGTAAIQRAAGMTR